MTEMSSLDQHIRKLVQEEVSRTVVNRCLATRAFVEVKMNEKHGDRIKSLEKQVRKLFAMVREVDKEKIEEEVDKETPTFLEIAKKMREAADDLEAMSL